jgi:hypothetical protein
VRRVALVLFAILLLPACGLMSGNYKETIDQRTSQGPVADELWERSIALSNGRSPTFEEKQHFADELEERIGKYLRQNEEAASDLKTLQAFRFSHQVTVGMHKDQVEVLLGKPFSYTDDAQQMANWARRHWPAIRGRADLAWTYPAGWIIYFDKDRVVDITQYLPGLY